MLEAILRLSYCRGIGPRLGKALLQRYRDPQVLFELPDDLPPRLRQCLSDPEAPRLAAEELQQAQRKGFTLIPLCSPQYPVLLSHLAAPPLVLRLWGTLSEQDALAVAVVGTRSASAYGKRQAVRFAGAFSLWGATVVSGLARGIDSLCHAEALREGGRTIAVLGSGLLHVYPPENRSLASKIASCGAVLSEFPLSTPPQAGHFPRRNRIIAGLSLAVVVIEAPARSGALITALHGSEQGRLVFAVPGPVDSPGSAGVHALLKEGASLAASPEDVLSELAPLLGDDLRPARPSEAPAPSPLTAEEALLLGHLPPGPVDPQAAAELSGLGLGQVLALLTSLELKGHLRRLGDTLQRIP